MRRARPRLLCRTLACGAADLQVEVGPVEAPPAPIREEAAAPDCAELTATAPPASASRRSATWSRWSAINGETTTVGPSSIRAGTC
ncbi:hypothetical protein FHR32_007538 [Streptosporangium album]|uniref:Uncharacterized protein n=1 Tax=Streptosporangium album TaxID=47479 RepID=A0A7W7WDS4_9ACTN|nr:hypothetical protein [Streptosporangium album]MBB4943138.1 hypothetical protein [Streptosporangium album]